MGHPQQTVRSQRVFLGIPQWFTQVASVELLGKGSFIFRQGKHPAFSLPTSPSFFRSARHAFGEISFQLLIVSFVYVWKRTLIWEILPMNMWVCLRMGCNRTISTIKCNFKRDNFDKPSNSGDSYGVITLNPNFRAESLLVNKQIPSEIFSASQEAQETSAARIPSQIGSFCSKKFGKS